MPVPRRALHLILPTLIPLLFPCAGCQLGLDVMPITVVPPLYAHVGREVSVPLAVPVSDETVVWEWRSLNHPELATRLRRPTVTIYTLGRAVWRWTPVADDIGPQAIEFRARTSSAEGVADLTLNVDSGSEAPVFREPVGEGTTLDLRQSDCVHVSVVVEATAASRVELSLSQPPAGATLVQTGDLAGELVFCPTPAQIADDTVYPLTILASAAAQTIQKTYVIVLRRP